MASEPDASLRWRHPSQHAGAAIKQGFEDTRCVLEPAGALALAGLKKHASQQSGDDVPTYVAVASGANMDFDRLRFVSERADTSEVRLAVKVPEEPMLPNCSVGGS